MFRLSHLLRLNLLRCSVLASGMILSSAMLFGQTYTDTTFPSSNWSTTVMAPSTAGASFTASPSPIGRPAPSWQTAITIPAAGGPRQTIVAQVYRPKVATIDPSKTMVGSLTFQYDLSAIQPPLNSCVGYAPLVVQGGTYYWAQAQQDSICAQPWLTFNHKSLPATAFIKLQGTGPNNPDFSCNGKPFWVGFTTAHSHPASGSAFQLVSNIDNWSVTVNPQGPPITPTFTLKITVPTDGSPGSPYPVEADWPIPPSSVSFGWFVYDLTTSTKDENDPAWWTPLGKTTFTGWTFKSGDRYLIKFGEWLNSPGCNTWTQASATFCVGGGC